MGESTLGNEKVKTRKKREKKEKKCPLEAIVPIATVPRVAPVPQLAPTVTQVTRQQPHVFNLSTSPQQPMYYQYYRRQTPEEDYLSTQQGIEILVKQRQQLVDQLTKHYRKLYRSNEIESLLKFSQQIDSIIRLRGFSIVPSPNPSSRTRRRLALPPMERGVTIHDQKF